MYFRKFDIISFCISREMFISYSMTLRGIQMGQEREITRNGR